MPPAERSPAQCCGRRARKPACWRLFRDARMHERRPGRPADEDHEPRATVRQAVPALSVEHLHEEPARAARRSGPTALPQVRRGRRSSMVPAWGPSSPARSLQGPPPSSAMSRAATQQARARRPAAAPYIAGITTVRGERRRGYLPLETATSSADRRGCRPRIIRRSTYNAATARIVSARARRRCSVRNSRRASQQPSGRFGSAGFDGLHRPNADREHREHRGGTSTTSTPSVPH